jgi:hypothetical protein
VCSLALGVAEYSKSNASRRRWHDVSLFQSAPQDGSGPTIQFLKRHCVLQMQTALRDEPGSLASWNSIPRTKAVECRDTLQVAGAGWHGRAMASAVVWQAMRRLRKLARLGREFCRIVSLPDVVPTCGQAPAARTYRHIFEGRAGLTGLGWYRNAPRKNAVRFGISANRCKPRRPDRAVSTWVKSS